MIRHGIIGRLKDRGIYLICLMRSHIQLEEQSVYEGITRDCIKMKKRVNSKSCSFHAKLNFYKSKESSR